jgi:hypothetical protein
MMVYADGSRRDIGPSDPYALGQLDAQRDWPWPPLYDDPAEAQAYAEGWREHDRTRPVPQVLHPRWRWLPMIRAWRKFRNRLRTADSAD